MLVLYALAFPIGYLLLHITKFDRFHSLSLFVRLPIYLSVGLVISTLLYYIIGVFTINVLVPVVVFVVIISILVFQRRKNLQIKKPSFDTSVNNLFPLILLVLSLVYLAFIVGNQIWPVPGDVMDHGFYTSLLLNQHRITFTFAPVMPSITVYYPLGLHILAANVSLLTGLYPGESLFLTAGAIVSIFPLALYSLTYVYTKSKTFSLLAYLSIFIVTPYSWATILRCLETGTYPRIYGYFVIATLCIITAITNPFKKDENGKNALFKYFVLLGSLLTVSLIIIYPSYSIYALGFLLITILINRYSISNLRKIKIFLVAMLAGIVILALYGIFTGFFSWVLRILPKATDTGIPLDYFSSFLGIAVIIAAGISVFFLIKSIRIEISLLYLIVLIPQLLSLYHPLYLYLVALTPYKNILINGVLSWVIIALFGYYLLNKLTNSKYLVNLQNRIELTGRLKKIRIRTLVSFCAIVILLSAFAPTILFSVNNVSHNQLGWNWFVESEPASTYDFKAMEWINANVSSKDLILNIPSWSALYLDSFSIKNMTNYYLNSNYERAVASMTLWQNPTNSTFLKAFITEYNVKYIFVTSEYGYYNWSGFGGDQTYVSRQYDYGVIFDNFTFLNCVFKEGDTRVYSVGAI
jgi:hypothetical protein